MVGKNTGRSYPLSCVCVILCCVEVIRCLKEGRLLSLEEGGLLSREDPVTLSIVSQLLCLASSKIIAGEKFFGPSLLGVGDG